MGLKVYYFVAPYHLKTSQTRTVVSKINVSFVLIVREFEWDIIKKILVLFLEKKKFNFNFNFNK
jgi:hypothetical protein